MKSRDLFVLLSLAAVGVLFQSALIPNMRISPLPCLFALLFASDPKRSLWIALCCGLFCDLFTSTPFGLCALNTTLTGFAIFRFGKYFFHEHLREIALFTLLISLASTAIWWFELFLFDKAPSVHGKWLLIDSCFLALLDSLYGILWLYLPHQAIRRIIKRYEIEES